MSDRKFTVILLLGLMVLALGGTRSRVIGQGGPLFVDISDDALGDARLTHAGPSVDFFPCQGNPFPFNPQLSLLGGALIADLNGDGWNDIFVTNGRGGANALYLNNADGAPTFSEVAEAAGVDGGEDEAAAAVAGDIDNDGDLDLYVSNVGLVGFPNPVQCPPAEGFNRLFLNMGNDENGIPQFVDVAAEAGAAGTPPARSQLPSLVDFDGDGDLDIFVAAHIHVVVPFFPADSPAYPFKRPPVMLSMLLQNNLNESGKQAGVSFTDVTDLLRNETSGAVGPDGLPVFDTRASYDGVWMDYDNDGDQDLFTANELGDLGVFRNNGSGPFTYVTPDLGLSGIFSSRGIAPGDINGDGNIDFFVSGIGAYAAQVSGVFNGAVHRLYLNDGNGGLTDVAGDLGIANPPSDGDTSGDSAWGSVMFDYDNDGDLDLFYAGNWFPIGFGVREPFPDDLPEGFADGGHANRGHLFENQGLAKQGNPILTDRLATAEQRAAAGIDNLADARAVAVGDLDNDGFQDIVIVNVSGFATQGTGNGLAPIAEYTGQVVIYKNQGNANRTLILRLHGTESNRDAIGARVTVVTDQGSQVRELRAGEGHYSQHSPEVEFGLGAADVQRIEIAWPSGNQQTIDEVSLTGQVTRLDIQEP